MNRIRIERRAGAGEAIHVWSARQDSAPAEFVWRGRRYRVRTLEPAPNQAQAAAGSARRFQVRTTSGLSCVLSHDGAGGWRIDRLLPTGAGR
jgi:hypothetical protein